MTETEAIDGITVVSLWSPEHQHYHTICAAASPDIANLIIQAFKLVETDSEISEACQTAARD